MITRDFIIIADGSKMSREVYVNQAMEQTRKMCSDMQCFRIDRIDDIGPDSLHVYVSGALANRESA